MQQIFSFFLVLGRNGVNTICGEILSNKNEAHHTTFVFFKQKTKNASGARLQKLIHKVLSWPNLSKSHESVFRNLFVTKTLQKSLLSFEL